MSLIEKSVHLLVTGIFLFFSFHTNGQQTSSIQGFVTDSLTGKPLTGALIINLNNKSIGTVSGLDGDYNIELIPGNYTFIFSFLGMQTDTFNVTLQENQKLQHDVLMTALSRDIGLVVVSAGKYEQNIEETTVSMQIIQPGLIESKNTVNIKSVLEQAPGLIILDEEPQIRGGSGFSFGVGSRVATLIDGLPILTGDAGRTDWSFIPTENIEQIEIIEGASSVLYGSSALSGTINFRTKYPTEKRSTYIRTYTGFYSAPENPAAKWWNGNANFSGLNFSHAIKYNNIDLIIGGQANYDHNFIGPYVLDGSFPLQADTLSNSDVANKSGRLNFNFRFVPEKNNRLSIGLNGNVMRSQNNFSLVWGNSSDQIYRAFPGTMTLSQSTGFYIDPYITYFTKSGVKHELKSRYFYSFNDNSNDQSNQTDVMMAEYNIRKTFNKIGDLNLTGGLFINNTWSHANLYSGSGTPDNKSINRAAFMQLDKKLFDILTLQAGVRGEYFRINDEESEFRPVFRSGMNLQLFEGTSLRASFGEGYRFPTITEKFIITTTGGIYVFANPEILPESSWSFETGIKQGFKIGSMTGYVDVVYFQQQYYDAIEYIYAIWAPDSAGFKFVNTGDTKIEGFEFSVLGKGRLTENIGIQLLMGYTYVEPKTLEPGKVFATDNPSDGIIPTELTYVNTSTDPSENILKYRFRHLVKGDLEVTYKNISVGGSCRYYSFMENIDKTFYDLDQPYLLPTGIKKYREEHDNGSLVFDARLSIKFAKNYSIAIISNNITNLEYTLRPLKIESPRTTSVQLSARF